MEFFDEITIKASQKAVYSALNDPAVLRQCIPGCDELIQHSPTNLEAKVVLKIGPVKARFAGVVTLNTDQAPDSFTLTGEGKGGAAGFARGSADVLLKEVGEVTVLSYNAKVQVGGKIAQVGSRLISGTAKKLSASFFAEFADIVVKN
jgi:carbon monoxide dehydrogenase subunit G